MLQKISLLFLFIALANAIQAQSNKAYFQQKVDYQIAVSLDDQNHILRGQIRMQYHNQSPDTLHFIYMHLWPNAYKNQRTAFAKQFTENGDRSFYFSKKEDRGYIDSLDFLANDQDKLKWTYDETHIDIAKIQLAQPLAPGQSVWISSPMKVKIPESVSRLGHVGESYQITQWYPKPAVYDRDGWHPMPYLDQGEFYSEFGSFDVKITLPENYYVASTGSLQTAAEWERIKERIAFSEEQDFKKLSYSPNDNFPLSSNNLKTLHYTADSIHDFAWFADKRFYITKSVATLQSGKTVDCYAYFTNVESILWQKASLYIGRSVRFYSDVVGEYPYPHATAVQSALGAGGGMEYPMVTVIGLSYSSTALDEVIMHEVGHNWFYGILASNEREHAWMDEGWNSYIESRYMNKYYRHRHDRSGYLVYLLQARRGLEQPIETPAYEQTNLNYFLGAYSKPTMVFRTLEQYLGTAEMDRILQKYFQTWKFKHPQPSDLRELFEQESGKDLSWVFDDLIYSTKHLDYGFVKGKLNTSTGKIRLTVRNKGQIAAPFIISILNTNDKVADSIWVEGIAPGKDTTLELPYIENHTYRIDFARELPEIRRNDNQYRPKAFQKVGAPALARFLFDTQNPEYPYVNFAPTLGFNAHDIFMLGMAVYSTPVMPQKWDYAFAPLYSFGSKSPVGIADIRYNHFPYNHSIRRISAAMSMRSFHAFSNQMFDYKLRYTRLNPNLEIDFSRKSGRDYIQHSLRVDNILLLEEDDNFARVNNVVIFTGKTNHLRSTHRVSHTVKSDDPINPFSIISMAEYANYLDRGRDLSRHYLKLTVEGNFKFYFAEKKSFDLRLFAGGFPWHTERDFGDFPLHLVSRNSNDYHYDEYIYGRRKSGSIFENQVVMREGGFKTPIAIAQSIADGRSNSFIFAANLKSDLPIKLPFGTELVKLKAFLDLGYFKNSAPSVTIVSISEEIFVNGGFMIDIWDGAAGIYLPLVGSNNLMNLVKQRGNLLNRVGFSFNLNRFNPRKADEILNQLY